jgi:hypothetical protein
MSKLRTIEHSRVSAEVSNYFGRFNTNSKPTHRSVLRGVAGYSVGGLGIGFTIGSILSLPATIPGALIVGGLGTALLWGSREIMRPNHITVEADQTKGKETKGRKALRAGLFVGGLALSVTGFNFALGGLFNTFEKSISAGWRVASLLGGTALMAAGGVATHTSYSDKLFEEATPTVSIPPTAVTTESMIRSTNTEQVHLGENAEYYS